MDKKTDVSYVCHISVPHNPIVKHSSENLQSCQSHICLSDARLALKWNKTEYEVKTVRTMIYDILLHLFL